MSEFDPRWTPGHRGQEPEQGQTPSPEARPGHYDGYGHEPGAGYGQPTGYEPNAGQPGLGGPPAGAWQQPGAYPGYQPTSEWRPGQQPGAEWQPGWQQQPTAQHPAAGWPPAYQPPRRRHPLRTIGITVGAVGLSVLVGLGIGRLAWPSNAQSTALTGPSSPSTGQNGLPGTSGGGASSTSLNPSAIAAQVDPGLVDVNTVLGYQSAQAAGTGIVLTSNGEILTNNHVVEGATSIKVTDIGNGKTYTASVVGYDRTHDIAVLQLQNASGLTVEKIGNSSKVAVGDAIVGIGNAGGAGGTPSVAPGTVTALNQQITASDSSSSSSEQLSGLIQVNANIQSGDSGGSLVNSAGEVIGVDTAASTGYQLMNPNDPTGQGGAAGHQGFAIPINQAMSIAKQIESGKGTTSVHIGPSAFLGVSVSSSSTPNTQPGQGGFGQGQGQGGLGQGQPGTGTPGAVIQQVLPGGAAEAAGLQAGDTITAVNGKTIDSATTLTNLLDQYHPGDKLQVTYLDPAGAQHTATVTPATGPVG